MRSSLGARTAVTAGASDAATCRAGAKRRPGEVFSQCVTRNAWNTGSTAFDEVWHSILTLKHGVEDAMTTIKEFYSQYTLHVDAVNPHANMSNTSPDPYANHVYFGVAATATSSNGQWALYTFRVVQSGVDIMRLSPDPSGGYPRNQGLVGDSLGGTHQGGNVGFHSGTWGYQITIADTTGTEPAFFMRTNYELDGTPLTIELTDYDHNHTPQSGNVLSSATGAPGSWVVRGSWSHDPFPPNPVSPPPSGSDTGYMYSVVIDNNSNTPEGGSNIDDTDMYYHVGTEEPFYRQIVDGARQSFEPGESHVRAKTLSVTGDTSHGPGASDVSHGYGVYPDNIAPGDFAIMWGIQEHNDASLTIADAAYQKPRQPVGVHLGMQSEFSPFIELIAKDNHLCFIDFKNETQAEASTHTNGLDFSERIMGGAGTLFFWTGGQAANKMYLTEEGHLHLNEGDLNITKGHLHLNEGDLNITQGDLNITNHLHLNEGDLNITEGDLNITNGKAKASLPFEITDGRNQPASHFMSAQMTNASTFTPTVRSGWTHSATFGNSGPGPASTFNQLEFEPLNPLNGAFAGTGGITGPPNHNTNNQFGVKGLFQHWRFGPDADHKPTDDRFTYFGYGNNAFGVDYSGPAGTYAGNYPNQSEKVRKRMAVACNHGFPLNPDLQSHTYADGSTITKGFLDDHAGPHPTITEIPDTWGTVTDSFMIKVTGWYRFTNSMTYRYGSSSNWYGGVFLEGQGLSLTNRFVKASSHANLRGLQYGSSADPALYPTHPSVNEYDTKYFGPTGSTFAIPWTHLGNTIGFADGFKTVSAATGALRPTNTSRIEAVQFCEAGEFVGVRVEPDEVFHHLAHQAGHPCAVHVKANECTFTATYIQDFEQAHNNVAEALGDTGEYAYAYPTKFDPTHPYATHPAG